MKTVRGTKAAAAVLGVTKRQFECILKKGKLWGAITKYGKPSVIEFEESALIAAAMG